MRSILITLPNVFSVRNLLFTGVLDRLASRFDGRVVICPAGQITSSDLGQLPENVAVEAMQRLKGRSITKVVQSSLAARFYRMRNPELDASRNRYLREKRPLHTTAKQLLAWPFPRSHRVFSALQGFDTRFGSVSKQVRDQFHSHSPGLVVATDPNTDAEYEYLRHARRQRIPSVGLIRSWDVPSTKGWFPVVPDDAIVWSDWVKRSVIGSHPQLTGHVHVTGAPHFDDYYRKAVPEEVQAAFQQRFNLDPEIPVVLYAGSPPRITEDEPVIVEKLAVALEGEAQILLRIHPQDNPARWSQFRARGVRVQVPGQSVAGVDGGRLMANSDLDEIRTTLACANVVVSAWSTMALDSAAMKKPPIAMAFDMKNRPPHLSIARFEQSPHIRQVIESGAVSISRSLDQLISQIRSDIEDPSHRQHEMRQLLEEMSGPPDGESGSRLVDTIVRLAQPSNT